MLSSLSRSYMCMPQGRKPTSDKPKPNPAAPFGQHSSIQSQIDWDSFEDVMKFLDDAPSTDPPGMYSLMENFGAPQYRTHAEDQEFKMMLPNINLVYLGMSVFVLLERSYIGRFWVRRPSQCASLLMPAPPNVPLF